jgi:hypothetical protein
VFDHQAFVVTTVWAWGAVADMFSSSFSADFGYQFIAKVPDTTKNPMAIFPVTKDLIAKMRPAIYYDVIDYG